MRGNRRKSALASVASRRVSLALTAPNLQALVRVYMIDGSSKVLQMTEQSTVLDVLKQLKYNLDLADISTCALFRVKDGVGARRLELHEVIQEVMKDASEEYEAAHIVRNDTQRVAPQNEARILFRTWIVAKCGVFEKEVFQEHLKHKSPNSALYLAYMEANLMCFTGRYYLSEDEAIMLGCLKMQAESGDFNSDIHTLDIIQQRVCQTFPRPISTRMRALLSPTLGGAGSAADELAAKIQYLYARIAGKHKAEAQIEFLQLLRTWCPFYGAAFFTVQCQYDDGSHEEEPPVSTITVAVGPLALFMITRHDNELTILRHPYKHIVKWVAYREKHIFSYWTIKQHINLRDIEEARQEAMEQACLEGREYNVEEEFDATPYCDCIYLVTPNCGELEHLVRSYVSLLKRDEYPCLDGAQDELLPPDVSQWYRENGHLSGREGEKEGGMGEDEEGEGEDEEEESPQGTLRSAHRRHQRRKSGRFKQLFSALGGYSTDSSSSSTSGRHSVSSASETDAIPAPNGASVRNKRSRRRSSSSARGTFWNKLGIASGSGLGADSDESEGEGGRASPSSSSKVHGEAPPSPHGLFARAFTEQGVNNKEKSKASPQGIPRGSFSSTKSIDDDEDHIELPDKVKYAASVSHIQRLALEHFSDDEDDETGEEEDDDDGGVVVTNAASLDIGGPLMPAGRGRPPPPPPRSPATASMTPPAPLEARKSPSLRRVSQILFGSGVSPSSTGTGHNDDTSSAESSGSEYESGSEEGSSERD